MPDPLLSATTLLPDLPLSAPRGGRAAWVRALGRLSMRLMGWGYAGGFADAPRQVLIGAPHTSNLDGMVGIAAAAATDVAFTVFAKDKLFWGPVGWVLRAFGGVPVDRSAPDGLVSGAVALLRGDRPAYVAITPEGTRSAVDRWKTGFYRIAVDANVPIGVVGLDWARKEVVVRGTMMPTGDLEADLATMGALLAGVEGRFPERALLPAPTGGWVTG